jgi:hypothetical protein
MSENKDKHYMRELKEMIVEKKTKEPVDKVFAVFCQRHGVSMNECKMYYDRLVENGEVKKE